MKRLAFIADHSCPARTSRALFKSSACAVALLALAAGSAHADTDINSGAIVMASKLSGAGNFKGGTLQLDGSSTTVSNNFTLNDNTGNTIDLDGHANTLSGVFSGAGPIIFSDSVGGGSATLTGSNTFTGAATIATGATLYMSGTTSLATASDVTVNGALDISQMSAGATLISMDGSGTVALGAQSLTLSTAAGSFTGTISGSGGLILLAGTESLSGANTYTGGTTITAGTLTVGAGGTTGSITGYVTDNGTLAFNRTDNIAFDGVVSGTGGLTQAGSGALTITAADTYTGVTTITAGTLALSATGTIANSSVVSDGGVFDISATGGASIKDLSGAGTVLLGGQTLTLTAAASTFSGTITGSGGVTVAGGTWLFSGTNNYTGPTLVSGGTLKLGAGTVNFNVTDNAIVAFAATGDMAMQGIISGTGAVQVTGTGVTTVTQAQTYTGTTTITAGTLALAAGGSIAASSGLTDNATFDISALSTGTAITSLSGSGSVVLGAGNLSLTDAAGLFSGKIAGTGTLTLMGGTETLSGANSFTGQTIISGGTLVLAAATSLSTSSGVIDNGVLDISTASDAGASNSATITSLGGGGGVVLGSKTLILTNGQDSFSGVISGAGGVTISGGAETFTGANSYTGTTTIAAGTLALSGAGRLAVTSPVIDNGALDISGVTGGSSVSLASLSGTGSVTLGGNALNLVNASGSFAGTILGGGGLTLSGGTEVLAGANTYTGGTIITAGTLQIGNGRTTGSIVGDVADNSVLAFDRADTMIFAGVISGAGSVSQIGAGTTVLTADNSYNGGTTISAGTLQLGNGGASGWINGNVTDNGTLAFARSDTSTFGGTISGAGGVSVESGTLILTAVNSYSGTTNIAGLAALTLSGGGSIAASSIVDNGVLDVSGTNSAPQVGSLAGSGSVILGNQSLTIGNASGDFSGVISGSGGLTVAGGNQTLSGVNTYTGATQVSGGTLTVNGAITSSSGIGVANGATLAGSGTVGNVSIASGGTLAPGSGGSGTLKVAGNLAMAGNSSLLVNVSSAAAPGVSVSGTAALSGTLTIASANGTWLLGQKEAVLTAAGGITGSFTTTSLTNSSNGAQFASTVSYDADDVYVQVDLAKLSPLLPAGSPTNSVNAIGGIDAAISAGDTLPSAFENLGNASSATLAADAQQMAGQIGADVPRAGSALFSPFLDNIFDHIGDTEQGVLQRGQKAQAEGAQVWASGFTGTTIYGGDADTGADKMKQRLSGLSVGVDWSLSPRAQVGGAISGGSTSFHLSGDDDRGRADSFMLAGYGHMLFSPRFYGDFALGVGVDHVTTTRELTVSGDDTLAGKLDGMTVGGRYETGFLLGWITPYLAIDDTLFEMPAYSEAATSGSDTWALHYQSRSANQAAFELGFRQQGDYPLNRNWTLRLTDQLAVLHNWSDTNTAKANYLALPDSDFTATGAPVSRDSVLFSLGAELKSRFGLGLDAHVESRISSHAQSYVGIAGINLGL